MAAGQVRERTDRLAASTAAGPRPASRSRISWTWLTVRREPSVPAGPSVTGHRVFVSHPRGHVGRHLQHTDSPTVSSRPIQLAMDRTHRRIGPWLAAVGDLLDGPRVAVGVVEEHEAHVVELVSAGHRVLTELGDLANLHAMFQ